MSENKRFKFLRFCDDPELACCRAEKELERLTIENDKLNHQLAEFAELAKAKAVGRLVEVVRCRDCRKIMTEECYLCSFDENGYCTGGPDDNQFCSFGEAALKQIGEQK